MENVVWMRQVLRGTIPACETSNKSLTRRYLPNDMYAPHANTSIHENLLCYREPEEAAKEIDCEGTKDLNVVLKACSQI